MSLKERIYSLETEYAVNFYPANKAVKRPNASTIVQTLKDCLVKEYGLSNCSFLLNGSKFHHDVGHAEWSLPECRTAREAAVYDKTADHLLGRVIPETEEILAQNRYKGHLLIAKNNVDSVGNTYGCHENYLMQRNTELLAGEGFLRYLVRCLVPFLTTRQILTGTGRVVSAKVPFEISQRASFIELTVSKETTKERAIVNLGRENEPLSTDNYRRLHLILGDANLSGWATWIKLGTTGILLRMIEDLFVVNIPLLRDPVVALQAISRDSECRTAVPLRNGQMATALDIQWHYYELADTYLERFGCSAEEDALMDAWSKALEDVETKPLSLRNRADWAIKKHLLEKYLEREGCDWNNLHRNARVFTALQAWDLRYHNIGQDGIYAKAWQPDTKVLATEIEKACKSPPPFTRARLRGEALTYAKKNSTKVKIEKWTEVSWNGKTYSLGEPLAFCTSFLPININKLKKAVKHVNPFIRVHAAVCLIEQDKTDLATLLEKVATQDKDEQVRRATIQAMGNSGNKAWSDVLIRCLQDNNPTVRWTAGWALDDLSQGKKTAPSPATMKKKQEPLIQILR
jgi:proteasome accessory factor A